MRRVYRLFFINLYSKLNAVLPINEGDCSIVVSFGTDKLLISYYQNQLTLHLWYFHTRVYITLSVVELRCLRMQIFHQHLGEFLIFVQLNQILVQLDQNHSKYTLHQDYLLIFP